VQEKEHKKRRYFRWNSTILLPKQGDRRDQKRRKTAGKKDNGREGSFLNFG
jgi:hypothetical protein